MAKKDRELTTEEQLDEMEVGDQIDFKSYWVLSVPGGWLYTFKTVGYYGTGYSYHIPNGHSVFVAHPKIPRICQVGGHITTGKKSSGGGPHVGIW